MYWVNWASADSLNSPEWSLPPSLLQWPILFFYIIFRACNVYLFIISTLNWLQKHIFILTHSKPGFQIVVLLIFWDRFVCLSVWGSAGVLWEAQKHLLTSVTIWLSSPFQATIAEVPKGLSGPRGESLHRMLMPQWGTFVLSIPRLGKKLYMKDWR